MKSAELREVTADEARRWSSSDLKIRGPRSLLPALRYLKSPQSLIAMIAFVTDEMDSPELKDKETAPGHFAKLMEVLVWRFELLVRDGVFDEALPRLSGLPILYSPRNGKGASQWEMARQLFESKRVGTDAFAEHSGLESSVARRIDFGVAAAHVAHLLWIASLELPELKQVRQRAVAFGIEKVQRRKNTESADVFWYHCGDVILRWPSWLDYCENLPSCRLDAPQRYREAAEGLLAEFFATPGNEIAEEMAGIPADDPGYSLAIAETKRRILDATDRL